MTKKDKSVKKTQCYLCEIMGYREIIFYGTLRDTLISFLVSSMRSRNAITGTQADRGNSEAQRLRIGRKMGWG